MQTAVRLISTDFSNTLEVGRKRTAKLHMVEMLLHVLKLILRHTRLWSIAIQLIIKLPSCSQGFALFQNNRTLSKTKQVQTGLGNGGEKKGKV